MALQAYTFTFAKTAGPTTGTQAIIANIPFEPIGLRFMSNGGTVSGTFTTTRQQSYGLAVPPGTGSRTTTFPWTSSLDQVARSILAVAPSAIYGNAYVEGACVYFHDNGGAFGTARNTAIGTLDSVDDLGGGLWGITIDWTTNHAVDPARLIHVTAYGGLTPGDEFVLFGWAQNSVNGTQWVRGVGFQPDFVETIGGDTQPGPGPTTGPGYHMHWGAMNCALEQVGVSNAASNGAGANVGVREHSTTAFMPVVGDETHVATVTLISMDASTVAGGGGGWTVTVSAPSSSAYGYGLHSFCMKNVGSYIGAFTKQATSTSNETVGTPGVTPVAVHLFGDNNTAVTGLQTIDRMAYGMMATTGDAWATAASNPYTPDTSPFSGVDYSDKVYAVLNNNTETIQALMTKVSLDSGSFTVGYDNNDAEETEILIAAVGDGPHGKCAGFSFAGTWVDNIMVYTVG